jgi:hypothetical protein
MYEYCVLSDYGDLWESAESVFQSDSLEECQAWAEDENYHSASIIMIDEDGKRICKVN